MPNGPFEDIYENEQKSQLQSTSISIWKYSLNLNHRIWIQCKDTMSMEI
jgi:hypothetical protein